MTKYLVCCPEACPQQHHLATVELATQPQPGDEITVTPDQWTFGGWLNMGYQIDAHQGHTGPFYIEAVEKADWEIDGTEMALRVRVGDQARVYMTDFYAHLACEARSDAPFEFLTCGCNANFSGFPELPTCPVCGCDELVEPETPEWTGICPECSSTFWWTEGSMYPDEHRHNVLRAEWAAVIRSQAKIVRDHKRLEELFQAVLAEDRLLKTESGWVFLMAPRTVAVKS